MVFVFGCCCDRNYLALQMCLLYHSDQMPAPKARTSLDLKNHIILKNKNFYVKLTYIDTFLRIDYKSAAVLLE